jgi:sulfite reductase alpha subunit-like flavoprotein
MKAIEAALEPITGYLFAITRNTQDGWYELEVGIPKGWVFDDNKEIRTEVITDSGDGKIVKICPKNNKVEVDDLVTFVQIIIETNRQIAEKERQFQDQMVEMRDILEAKAKDFYKELDELKQNSFQTLNANFEKELGAEGKEKRRRRTTKTQEEIPASGDTTTQTETTTPAQ